MKFLLTTILSLLLSVAVMYYLLTNPNFLPMTSSGDLNWVNMFVFVLVASIFFFSLFLIILYIVGMIIKSDGSGKEKVLKSVKFAIILTVGLVVVFFLHIFHIIGFFWGLGILLFVLILIFVV